MAQLKIRDTGVELPGLPDETEFARVEALEAENGLLSRFKLAETRYRALELKGMRLLDGMVRSLHAETARVQGLDARSVKFVDCELGDLRWTGGRLSRTQFDGCKLLGARFENVILDHVVFSGCRLDYATVGRLRAVGPVLFLRCSLREAEFRGCNLERSLFHDCDLGLTDFGPGGYRGLDLRGNDLSGIRGAQHLSRVVIDRAQLLELAQALAAELEVSFGDDS
jgi:uncharacterized protein YjbI with pentapeptide repeats